MATYDLTSSIPSSIATGDILNCPYSGNYISLNLPPGTYKLECWGAQGGTQSSSYPGGKGGYSTGILTSQETYTLYLYSGGQSSSTNGGFNGGGNGGTQDYGTSYGGGGASDIRIGTDSLYSRVIVAGGGGAGYADTDGANYSGAGGVGGGTGGNGNYSGSNTPGQGGAGDFGVGGNFYAAAINSNTITTPGGGGWYGGTGGKFAGGGGGSGYVYTSSTASQYPIGCLLNSIHYLTTASTINGDTSFTGIDGSSETGHSGNGYIRITIISVSGNGGGTSHTSTTYDLTTSIPSKIRTGDILNCPYSGSYVSITLPKGTYKLECWGAQGGSYSTTYYGGKGGYSVGTLSLSNDTLLYLYVGGAGTLQPNTSAILTSGGFNGGGDAYTSSASYPASTGGGASDIRIDSTSLYSRIIVAGGGGGSAARNYAIGGYGGGISGGSGNTASSSYTAGGGATQTAIGTSYYSTTAQTSSSTYGTIASFGQGGSGASSSYVSGGGGGWYGGGFSRRAAGGGGSGYVYTSSTASNYPSGCLLSSNYYLEDASTTAGNASFTDPDGTTVTGHSGNGYVRITVIKVASLTFKGKINNSWVDFVAGFVKVNGVWKEITSASTKVNGWWTPRPT